MLRRNLSFIACLVALVVVLLAGHYSAELNSVRAESAMADEARLKELLKERLSLRKRALEILSIPGIGSKTESARAQVEVFRAELDICETRAQRIEVLERIVDQTKKIEALLGLPGVAGSAEQLAGPIMRVEAEIALERERLKP
jgi:hypothetical protein